MFIFHVNEDTQPANALISICIMLQEISQS